KARMGRRACRNRRHDRPGLTIQGPRHHRAPALPKKSLRLLPPTLPRLSRQPSPPAMTDSTSIACATPGSRGLSRLSTYMRAVAPGAGRGSLGELHLGQPHLLVFYLFYVHIGGSP